MAKSKTKESKKAEVAAPVPRGKKAAAGVTKPAQTPKTKEAVKATSKKVVKEETKKSKKKVVEPESSESESSESEEEKDSDASANEDDSDSESSEEEAPKKEAQKPAAKAESESSDSDDSESEEEEKPKAKAAAVESSDSDDSESEDEKKPAAKESESNDNSDSSDDSDDESDEAEKAAPPSKKRKAEEETEAPQKKAKSDDPNAAPTLFAGSLSWGVDDNILYKAFESFDGLVGARVVTDKLSGRSRGFGYVDFNDSASAAAAYAAMQGKEIEGRAINLDYANTKPTDATPQNRAADRAQKHGDTMSQESDTLFVGNLPFDVDQDIVTEFFNEVRAVVSVRLPTDPESGSLKGFGYVTFGSVEDAKAALEEKNGAPIGSGRSSRNVRLDYSSPRPQGGAGGGRGGFGGRGGGRGGGGRGGGGRGRGGPRGGGRGGFSSANRSGPGGYSGTKISFD